MQIDVAHLFRLLPFHRSEVLRPFIWEARNRNEH